MTEVMTLAGVAVALGLVAGARPVILLLGGDEFEGAAAVLRIQAFALVTIFVGAAWTASLIGLGRLRQVATVSACGVGVLVATGLPLTAVFGIKGSAAAIVLADVVLAVGLWNALRRAGPGRAPELGFLSGGVVAAIPAGLACAAAVWVDGAVWEAALAVLAPVGVPRPLLPAGVVPARADRGGASQACGLASSADARRTEHDLPGARGDRRHGDLRARARPRGWRRWRTFG